MTEIIGNVLNNLYKNEDGFLSIAVLISYLVLSIQFFILTAFDLGNSSIGSLIKLVSLGLTGFAFLLALPVVLKRNSKLFIITLGISIILFFISYFVYPQNRSEIFSVAKTFFLMCIPSFVYSASIINFDSFYFYMKKISDLVFVICALISIIITLDLVPFINQYSMALSNYMLLPLIVNANDAFKKLSKKNLFVIIFLIFMLVTIGTRGSLLMFIIFVLFKLYQHFLKDYVNSIIVNKDIKKGIKSVLFVVVVLVSIYGLLFLSRIILSSLEFHSRTLRLLLEGGIYLSGRDRLIGEVLNELYKVPIIGLGIAGDRVILNGAYVHNLFVEVLANFGFVFGLIFLILFITFIIKVFIKNKDKRISEILVIWLCLGLLPLMLSSSYLIDFKFWTFVGLLFATMFINKNKIESNR